MLPEDGKDNNNKGRECLSEAGNDNNDHDNNEGDNNKGVECKFEDLGGMDEVIKELRMEVILPFCRPELPKWLGVRPISGLLLHGPPGCGKTTLAHAIAHETGVPFYEISASEVVSGVSGESEESIRSLFDKAYRTAPSIVFIDEIDAIASKRENLQRQMERRIVTQLMTCMDQFHQNTRGCPGFVLFIAATNCPDTLDQALRRPGRFDREISLGVPDEKARREILSMLTKKVRTEGEFDLFKTMRLTPGFVGADLKSLVNKAGNLAMKRSADRMGKSGLSLKDLWRKPWDESEMERLIITMADFEEAIKMVQPSFRREDFSPIPNVAWDDVGGLNLLREEFDSYIVQRIKHPELYEEFGINQEAGFLLFGPPGCGKTLIAKAVAKESGANFIHIPVDALTTRRGTEEGRVVERVLNQILVHQLDGADDRQGVYVIGATNRIEVMDPAVLRPGRFGKILYVPLPDADQRLKILKAHARNKPIDADVDLLSLSHNPRCNNLTGADLASLMNDAAVAALKDRLNLSKDTHTVKSLHFHRILSQMTPSVSHEQRNYFEALSQKYTAARVT